jgi:serine kinase of HPr protein (carbohydrate metabolism regulator)
VPGTIHATAVSVAGAGVLLVGRPGSGKSDLALRLIDRGAILIADDRVITTGKGGRLWLSAPPTITGLLEVRGVGLLPMPTVNNVEALCIFDLDVGPERLPEPATRAIDGANLPLLALSPFESSAPLKIELAVAVFLRGR